MKIPARKEVQAGGRARKRLDRVAGVEHHVGQFRAQISGPGRNGAGRNDDVSGSR